MLLAIPVKRLQAQPENAFELRFVVRHGDERGQVRVIIKRQGFDVGVDLEPRPMRVIHEEQADPVVSREVASADILAVAAIVGKGERMIIDQLKETARAAPMLDVVPSRFRNGRHVKAIAIGNERSLILAEAIELAAALEGLPDAIRTHLGLHGPDAGCHGDVQKSI